MGADQASEEAKMLGQRFPGYRRCESQVLPFSTRLSWLQRPLRPSQANWKRFQYFWGRRRAV
jgi:hypothetical protein